MKTIENTSFKANENTNENLNKVEQEIELLKQENEELKAKVRYYLFSPLEHLDNES